MEARGEAGSGGWADMNPQYLTTMRPPAEKEKKPLLVVPSDDHKLTRVSTQLVSSVKLGAATRGSSERLLRHVQRALVACTSCGVEGEGGVQ